MFEVTTKLRMRPVECDGWWKIEASILVRGKWEVLLRQGEYGDEREAQDALDEKIKRCENTRMKNER